MAVRTGILEKEPQTFEWLPELVAKLGQKDDILREIYRGAAPRRFAVGGASF